MSSPYNTSGPGGPGPSFEPAGGYSSGAHSAPTPDPYASRPATNLYGQPVDPYAQHGMSPYGSYGGGSYGVYAYPQQPAKSKVAAALLAFFLGTLGAHSFYLGKKGLGIGHLALVAAGFTMMMVGVMSGESGLAIAGVGYLLWAANSLWAFVEFIIILVTHESDLGR
ncbi:hypothetical protein GCM10028820_23020 [Tessaracoccus terricola]